MAQKQEERLQTAVANYIKMQYPNVIFTSESSGIRVSMGVAVQMKRQRSKHKLPDLIILEPKGKFHGLCIELKKNRKEIYLKDGSLSSKKHVQEQKKTLDLLNEKGYKAVFSCGFDETQKIIDEYMSL